MRKRIALFALMTGLLIVIGTLLQLPRAAANEQTLPPHHPVVQEDDDTDSDTAQESDADDEVEEDAADVEDASDDAADETDAAQEDDGEPEQVAESDAPSNDYCLLCHSNPDRVWELPSGETLSLHVDAELLAGSVHGADNPEGALACADCHVNHRFPHEPSTAQNIREFQIERYASCRTCHEDQYTRSNDSVHGQAISEGQLDAATCVDCHGSHNVQVPNEPRERVSVTCGQCHGAIFTEYRESVHGQALFEDQNEDVPTCIDCHGVHDISDPTVASYRVRSPQICADCHADEELMSEYGIQHQRI